MSVLVFVLHFCVVNTTSVSWQTYNLNLFKSLDLTSLEGLLQRKFLLWNRICIFLSFNYVNQCPKLSGPN